MQKLPNNILTGIVLGACMIIASYGIITLLFEVLVSNGVMDETTISTGDRRFRTTCLISICANLIFIQLFNKRKFYNIQRGVAIITVLSALTWVLYFRDSLFIS